MIAPSKITDMNPKCQKLDSARNEIGQSREVENPPVRIPRVKGEKNANGESVNLIEYLAKNMFSSTSINFYSARSN